MADRYSTIQQHQQLRVPSSWGAQEKSLVVQLDEIFDDIYRRFGRLRMEDMGQAFQSRIISDEGNIAELNVSLGSVEARVESVEGDISQLTVDLSGITGRVSGVEGAVSQLTIDMSGIAGRVTSAEGNIASLVLTAQGLRTDVDNKISKTAVYQTADSIYTAAVNQAATAAGNTYLAKTSTYQTATDIVNEAVAQAATSAGNTYIAKTSSYQTAQSIVNEAVLQAATDAVNNYIKKTTSYQTADAIYNAAVNQAATAAGNTYIAKTSTYQTAASIVSTAEGYTDNKLTSYSTTTQMNNAISAYVTNNAYKIVSGIAIDANGVDITGAKYVKIRSGGSFLVDATNFKIDSANKYMQTGNWTFYDGGMSGEFGTGTNKMHYSLANSSNNAFRILVEQIGLGDISTYHFGLNGLYAYANIAGGTAPLDLGTSSHPWGTIYGSLSWSNVTGKPSEFTPANNSTYYVLYKGNIRDIGESSPASGAKTYFQNNIRDLDVNLAYNNSGTEYTMIFSRGGSTGNWGSILRFGYGDRYIRILRKQGSWLSDDWEKIYAGYADSAGTATDNTKVAKSGDTMTGNLTLSGSGRIIYYTGTKSTYPMIQFIDNTVDAYGNGIAIGGGGATIIGGGESATTAKAQIAGGNEIMYVCNDGDVHLLTNMDGGWASRKDFNFTSSGNIVVPATTRIYQASGDMYFGTSGNSGWLYFQDMRSQNNNAWTIQQNGNAQFIGTIQAASFKSLGGDVVLSTTGSSSDDSSDLVWIYGNGYEKMRIWAENVYTAKVGPRFRINKNDGTSLYNGYLPLADGTSASGTWGISVTGSAGSVAWGNVTGKPNEYAPSDGSAYYVLSDGNLTSLGSGTPAAATKTYFSDSIANNRVTMAYNTSGSEYALLFARGGSANYGTVLKWGYDNTYIYMLRMGQGTWRSTDWEKISAGYADSAGSVAWANVSGKPTLSFTTYECRGSYTVSSGGSAHANLSGTVPNGFTSTGAVVSFNTNDNNVFVRSCSASGATVHYIGSGSLTADVVVNVLAYKFG